MKRLKQVINFIALATIFDWMLGQERPTQWLNGDIFFWQKPATPTEKKKERGGVR